MKKKVYSLVAIILFSQLTVIAQQKKVENTLLWEISGNGLQSPCFVFGTMHLLCEEDAPLGDSLVYAISSVGSVYFEIDLNDLLQMVSMFKYLNMKNGLSLEDLLSTEDFQRLMTVLEKRKLPVPISMVKKMKPIFLSGLLSESLFDCKTKKGMEEVILKESKKYRLPIKGLETIGYQAGLFDSIPYEIQAKDLMTYVDSLDVIKVQNQQLVELYKKQALEEVGRMSIQTDPGMENFLDLLLYRRNLNWSEKFENISKGKPCLIAVGAAHLPGEKGLLNLLREKGYQVRPVENQKKKGTYQTIVP